MVQRLESKEPYISKFKIEQSLRLKQDFNKDSTEREKNEDRIFITKGIQLFK
jgi:hypothetical protein